MVIADLSHDQPVHKNLPKSVQSIPGRTTRITRWATVGTAVVLATIGLTIPRAVVGPSILSGSCPSASPVTVAIVDTGVAPLPDLDAVMDASDHHTFVAGESATDDNGHGTQMAFIIHQVAPDARLLDAKALDSQGGGSQDDLAAAIRFAANHGASIINLSESGASNDPQVAAAIAFAGQRHALVVAAAGNDGLDANLYPSFPADDHAPNVLAVAATDSAGHLIGSSDYGPSIAVAAPGLSIATRNETDTPIQATGTSPAAAEVSGVAALILGANPQFTVDQLRQAVLEIGATRSALVGQVSSGRWIDPPQAQTELRATEACAEFSKQPNPPRIPDSASPRSSL